MHENCLHLAVGRAISWKYTNIGTLGWVLGGYRYSPPSPTHPYPYPGYTPPPLQCHHLLHGCYRQEEYGRGLKSVQQLTLGVHFSGFQGITEGYNLVKAGNADDHKLIPGFD